MMNKRERSGLFWVAFGVAVILSAVVGIMALTSSARESERAGRDAFVHGSYVTWEVITECERGSDACTRVLDKHNRELEPEGLTIYEDGSIARISG